MEMAAEQKKQDWEERSTVPDVYSQSGVRARVIEQEQPLSELRILWVDPDHAFSSRCRAMLEGWGACVVTVESAGSGLDAATVACPDIVVVSYEQEGTTGDQVARVLHYMLPDAPPVLMLSRADLRGFEGGLPGVVRILPRTFHPEALLEVLVFVMTARAHRGP